MTVPGMLIVRLTTIVKVTLICQSRTCWNTVPGRSGTSRSLPRSTPRPTVSPIHQDGDRKADRSCEEARVIEGRSPSVRLNELTIILQKQFAFLTFERSRFT